MPIYHFIVDYTLEKAKIREGVRGRTRRSSVKLSKELSKESSRESYKSNILVLTESYQTAQEKVQKHIQTRKGYTGNIADYNVIIDWIEKDKT